MRDYIIEIYPAPSYWKIEDWPQYRPNDWQKYSQLAEEQVTKMSPIIKSRVRDFWGGVHKNLLVCGSGYYFVKIRRNYSFNTTLSAVYIDRLIGESTDEEEYGIPAIKGRCLEFPPLPPSFDTAEGRVLLLLWKTLDSKYAVSKSIDIQRYYRLLVYRKSGELLIHDTTIKQFSDSIQRRLNLWNPQLRAEWLNEAKISWNLFYDSSPSLRRTIEEQKLGVPAFLQKGR